MSKKESRTFQLDKQIVTDLISDDFTTSLAAIRQLTECLTREEVSDVGLQISLSTGAEAIKKGGN